jgi:lysophospholipase L1-like esterase
VIYVVLLHVLVGVLVAKTDFLPRVGKRLGLVPPDEREEWFAKLALPVVEQVRRDRAVAGSALVVLGDSIAEEIDATRLAGDAVNYGIGGDTTRTLLWRLPALGSVEHARAVVVNVGVNDLKYRPVPAIAADYRALLARLPPSAALVVVSPLPVDEAAAYVRRTPHLRNDALGSLNAALRPVCEERPNCRFLDAWPVFWDGAAGGLRPLLHIGDGLHLSPAGSRELEALIRGTMDAAPGSSGHKGG